MEEESDRDPGVQLLKIVPIPAGALPGRRGYPRRGPCGRRGTDHPYLPPPPPLASPFSPPPPRPRTSSSQPLASIRSLSLSSGRCAGGGRCNLPSPSPMREPGARRGAIIYSGKRRTNPDGKPSTDGVHRLASLLEDPGLTNEINKSRGARSPAV